LNSFRIAALCNIVIDDLLADWFDFLFDASSLFTEGSRYPDWKLLKWLDLKFANSIRFAKASQSSIWRHTGAALIG
jgi:hypothetical protein